MHSLAREFFQWRWRWGGGGAVVVVRTRAASYVRATFGFGTAAVTSSRRSSCAAGAALGSTRLTSQEVAPITIGCNETLISPR
jgi:hypothetical protein